MAVSVLSLSRKTSLWPRLPLSCFGIYNNSCVSSDHNSHMFCSFDSFLLFVAGWSFFSFLHPSLAVFQYASVFNQDVSNWNTGAVTNMKQCKCTLSPP
jgi:surface protein